jgi:hypothetical protein
MNKNINIYFIQKIKLIIMKHLKTFENFTIEETNEFFGGVRKFVTGHESGDAKNAKKAEIEESIEKWANSALEAGWTPERIEQRKMSLLKRAADNNWRGYIRNGQYQELWTDLEALGSAAAGAHSGYARQRPR